MFTRIALILALLSPSLAFADDVTVQPDLSFERAPNSHEVSVQAVDGDTYTVHSAVGVSIDREPILLAQADIGSAGSSLSDAGSASAPAAAPAPATTPQPSDIGVATKLYKSGSFFALGIMVLFLGLSIWSKLDKKHAFYIATGLGGLALLVESIRKGDTPNATSVVAMLSTTVGIMIAGPGHVKVAPPTS
jgi:hypothetical protein